METKLPDTMAVSGKKNAVAAVLSRSFSLIGLGAYLSCKTNIYS